MSETSYCGAMKGTLVCLKEPHTGRHKFRPRPHVPPVRKWELIESFEIETGLIRNPVDEVRVGFVVGVVGKQGEWTVVRIEQHSESSDINVEVLKKSSGESHIYRSEKIRWKRQKGGVSRQQKSDAA